MFQDLQILRVPLPVHLLPSPVLLLQDVLLPLRRKINRSGAQTGSLSAIFAKPAVQPVAERSLFAALNTPKPAEQAPVERSLFGALNGAPKPAEQTPVARSLFAALNSTAKPVAAQAVQFGTQAQTDAQRTENDQVALVFSRLRNPQSNGAASSPDKDLRSLFGFLKK